MEKSLTFYLSLIFICFLSSCKTDEGEHITYYQKEFSEEELLELSKSLNDGISNYSNGKPGQVALLHEAIKYDENNSRAYRSLASLYYRRGFPNEFAYYYNKAVELKPIEWQGSRGYTYLYFFRNYKKALKDFDATDVLTPAQVDYPHSTSIDYMRGICYLKLDYYQSAIKYLKKFIIYESSKVGIDYVNSRAFLYKGIAHWKVNELTEAEDAFRTGISIDPDNADLHFWTAKLLLEIGAKKAALQKIREARKQFEKENSNTRYYVEDFFQIYLEDIEDLEYQITNLVEM